MWVHGGALFVECHSSVSVGTSFTRTFGPFSSLGSSESKAMVRSLGSGRTAFPRPHNLWSRWLLSARPSSSLRSRRLEAAYRLLVWVRTGTLPYRIRTEYLEILHVTKSAQDVHKAYSTKVRRPHTGPQGPASRWPGAFTALLLFCETMLWVQQGDGRMLAETKETKRSKYRTGVTVWKVVVPSFYPSF